MSDLLAERVIIVAATQNLTLDEAADIVADELTRDTPWTALVVGNIVHVDFGRREK
jgi:hypothetical protein